MRAEEIIAEALAERGWKESDLSQQPEGDGAEVALAARPRAETTLTVEAIAERLRMGSRSNLSNKLYEWRKKSGKPKQNRRVV